MTDADAPQFVARADGLKLAVRHRPGSSGKPTIVFLPGYASDMLGGKAIALDAWAEHHGHAMLRLDYSGCGESEGTFADGTLSIWRDDARFLIETLVEDPILLVGSSMGGWLALLLAEVLDDRVKALVGIAAAPDFTEWGFTDVEKATLAADSRLLRTSDYGPEPMLTTRGFWEAGQANLLLSRGIAYAGPVRLLQGQRDDAVPWEIALRTAEALRSDDVQVTLIKDGDHLLSRDADIALHIATVEKLMETL